MRPGPITGGAVQRVACLRRLGHLALRAAFFGVALVVPTVALVGTSAVSSVVLAAERAIVLDIDGVIGPAVAGYVLHEIKAASPERVGVIVLRMNTPGGLDSSMREIIGAMLGAKVPVATYVAPAGARAASAGTYIAYASAIAAMAPGTNIGAATPVQLGGNPFSPGGKPEPPAGGKPNEPADTGMRKAVNDAIAYIRGLAGLHGRNADWAEDAVRNAASIPASEALKINVIDVVADDIPDLLRKIDGRIVSVAGKPTRLATAGLDIAIVAPGWRTELLAAITNPNIAFLLLLIGIYGLIFEFLNPGAVAPGVIGAISLLVALYALNLLPINYAGLGLVLLGIGLMVAEAHIGSFGVIGVGGIAAFVIGAIIMFPAGAPGLELAPSVIAAAAAVAAGLFMVGLTLLLRSRRRAVVTGEQALIGSEGEALSWRGDEGRVRVMGEIWRARAAVPPKPGARVKVIGRDGLVLLVASA
ncbi:MAG: nodulation protein NfeD [Xanthobacteraceae bacterium]|nr:nodulation protein NfeD [Xanthobacteraceae bacterium]